MKLKKIKPRMDFMDETSKGVYDPDSDTFCLMDAIEKDYEFLISSPQRIVVDFGCGSGILGAHNRLLMQRSFEKMENSDPKLSLLFSIDVNHFASEVTGSTLKQNASSHHRFLPYEVLSFDLSKSRVLQKLKGKVDMIIWNPPYVPSALEETSLALHQRNDAHDFACAGGESGMSVVNTIFPLAIELLCTNGLLYLLLIEQNRPKKFISDARNKFALSATVVLERLCGERYTIVRFQKLS